MQLVAYMKDRNTERNKERQRERQTERQRQKDRSKKECSLTISLWSTASHLASIEGEIRLHTLYQPLLCVNS